MPVIAPRVRPVSPGAVRGGVRGAVDLAAGRAAVLAMMACGLAAGCTAAGAPPAAGHPPAGAPFVYVTGKGATNEIAQFASLGSGALRPLTPANVAAGEFPYDIAISLRGTSAYAVDNLSAITGAVLQYTLNPVTGKLTPKSPRMGGHPLVGPGRETRCLVQNFRMRPPGKVLGAGRSNPGIEVPDAFA